MIVMVAIKKHLSYLFLGVWKIAPQSGLGFGLGLALELGLGGDFPLGQFCWNPFPNILKKDLSRNMEIIAVEEEMRY